MRLVRGSIGEVSDHMKLDRNINANRRGKYALLKLRRLTEIEAWDGSDGEALDRKAALDAIALLERAGILDWGYAGTDGEFFVIRLKDKYAGAAIEAYANAVAADARKEPNEALSKDKFQWSVQVLKLAENAGPLSPFCKQPD